LRTFFGARCAAESGGSPDRGRQRSAAYKERLHLALEERDTNSKELRKPTRKVREASWDEPFWEYATQLVGEVYHDGLVKAQF